MMVRGERVPVPHRVGRRGCPQAAAGFTLVELLIVVAVIGLLIAIAVPTLALARGAAGDVAAKADLKSAMTAIELYVNINNEFPAGEADLAAAFDFRLSGGVSFSNFEVKVKNGILSAHMHVGHIGSANDWHANYPAEGSDILFRKGKLGE